MAVYKQTYVPYQGPLRNDRWRFTILTRFSFMKVFQSRLLAAFFSLCFIPPLLAGAILYANHNAQALMSLSAPAFGGLASGVKINGAFFNLVFRTQAFLSFLLVTFAGPGLVSGDIANNAIVIYLSKPFSRAEYVMGRLTVLLALTSAVTWVPAVILLVVQTDLAGFRWLHDNYRVAAAFLVAYWLWIAAISLLALAVSAVVKWRPLATGGLLVIFFAGAGFATMTNQILVLNRQWGLLMSLDSSISMVFYWLMEGETERGHVPAWTAFVTLVSLCLACVALLRVKIRAYEEVR
jgi:ABC-2 type transport system permease protein